MLARFIALRYAQARSGSALLGFISRVSMAGLVVAVALLITVLAVMNGFEHELRTRILRVVPAITLYPEENEIAEWKVVAQEVLKNPQVTAASPLIEAQGLLVMGSAAEPVLLFATDPVAESKLSHFEEFTDASAWDAWLADPQSVLISRKLANKLGVQAGGTAVVEPSTILTSRQVAVVLVGYHWMDMILNIWMEKTTMDMVILSSHGLTQQYKEKW